MISEKQIHLHFSFYTQHYIMNIEKLSFYAYLYNFHKEHALMHLSLRLSQ